MGIYQIIGPLYDQGLSIADISVQTGLKKTHIWKTLKKNRQELRAQSPVPFTRWRSGHGKTRARPPYGFCHFQGEIIKDPREYPTLQLILSLAGQGKTLSEIQRHLQEKHILSRTGKPWSYNVIKATVARALTAPPSNLPTAKQRKSEKAKMKKEKKHEPR